jgi:hypothetical protein
MSITLEVDEEILRKAEAAANIHDPTVLIRRLLEREIERKSSQVDAEKKNRLEAAKRLADLGGTMPNLAMPRRRRSENYIP